MHPIPKAVESGDLDAVAALLADDVVFTSPVTFKPYPGKAITATILRGALRVFEDLTYIREIANPDGRDHAFVFTATVAGKQLQGCDFVHFVRCPDPRRAHTASDLRPRLPHQERILAPGRTIGLPDRDGQTTAINGLVGATDLKRPPVTPRPGLVHASCDRSKW